MNTVLVSLKLEGPHRDEDIICKQNEPRVVCNGSNNLAPSVP
jgi:hypothetical protein